MGKGLWLGVLFGILLLSLNSSQFVFADGDDSPPECDDSDFKDDNIPDDETMSMYDAGDGNIITGICIKSGNDAFGDLKHSGLITTDGTYGDANHPQDGLVSDVCFEVEGLGEQKVIVTEVGPRGCKDLSHVHYFIESDGVPPGEIVGGKLLSIDTTALLLAGVQSTTWTIPVMLSIVGIGMFVVSRKSENS
ncbi:MAG: hypothetical protein ACREAK_03210 [Nitrosarchaeum sp.]